MNSQGGKQGSHGQIPLLVHFDVNKTVIQSDSIQMKGIEDGIREGIAELFWGYTNSGPDGKLIWDWTKSKPSCYPPVDEAEIASNKELMTYFDYCRKVVKDKSDRKDVISQFKYCGEDARAEMDRLLQVTVKKMQLPPDIRYSKVAEDAGLKGATISMFPTLFHFVAALQRSKRTFAILFRSFGADHETIKAEWNAFCERKHPVYSKFLEGVGPMDGTREGVPDRRIHALHTMYRDEIGPIIILNTFTNGPNEKSWDSWAKTKPKPTVDDRNGRDYALNVLKADIVDGMFKIQSWMKTHIYKQETAAIKDDWAWWQWHGEKAHAGKLLTLIGGTEDTEQLFFDDNIDIRDTRIVDCRDENGNPVPREDSINKVCTKVNPVEALLDDGYFLRKLQLCHGEHLDLGASLIDFQRQLTEVEDQKSSLAKQVKTLKQQLKTLTEENRRMKLLHRINVKSVEHLRELLARDLDLETFGKDGFRTVADLFWEIENGHCWLELDETGKLVRCFEMLFLKIIFKGAKASEDLILIESHEQDSNGRVQSRNYLPGVRKLLHDQSFSVALERWLERGLGENLSNVAKQENMPAFTPDAPEQQTTQTLAFPITVFVQQSECTYIIHNKEVNFQGELLGKVGLSAAGGKHFTFPDTETIGGTVTRFFRWDKVATWEASVASASKLKSNEIDIAMVCDKLFRGHPRREVYENLLLQMFEVFTAKKLCGGFSGSIVIRVQPFEPDGRPSDPCIVKLDNGDAIRDEYINSENVFKALPDRAARILGDAAYAKSKAGEEFGAMRLELAGACWNVPELAQGSANLLVTFKDLLLYEGDQVMLGEVHETAGDIRPFGNVNSILAETFGPGGVVASLRKGGNGLHRENEKPLLWNKKSDGIPWYTLKGKKGRFNPYTAKPGEYPPEPRMRRLYQECFGEEMPDLMTLVEKQIRPKLEELASKAGEELYPLVALAHGDLNAANIMIDALDAVWLIDFATSVDLPLFTDMCKFEMACLFEYSIIPITPATLLNFASADKEHWSRMNVGDWLRVSQDVGEMLMQELVEQGNDRVAAMSAQTLSDLIQQVASKSGKAPHKQREIIRALSTRLTAHSENMRCAFKYAGSLSKTLIQGDYVLDSLQIKDVPHPEATGQKGAGSLKFFMDIAVAVRRFTYNDIGSCLREYAPNMEGLQPCDAMSLQMWLPILRESYRLIGYGDVPPQQKIWSIYHCSIVAGNVLRMLETLTNQARDLKNLPMMKNLRNELASQKEQKGTTQELFAREAFTGQDSLWFYSRNDLLPIQCFKNDKLLRKVYSKCGFYGQRPGYFAPIFQMLDADDHPLPLSFSISPEDSKKALDICVDITDLDCDESQPLLDPEIKNGIGFLLPDGAVTLKSRLFFMTQGMLKAKSDEAATLENEDAMLDDCFQLSEWSSGILNEALTPDKHGPGRHEYRRQNSEKSNIGSMTSFRKFMILDAKAYHPDGRAVCVKLVLGMPSLCYPLGSKLCIDTAVVEQQRSASPEVVIMQFTDQGSYRVRDAAKPNLESERDFAPSCNNHVYLTGMKYKKKERMLLNKDNSWVECEVAEPPSADTGYRCRLNLMMQPLAQDMSGGMAESDANQIDPNAKGLLRYVNTMNSGIFLISASAYEEEVSRIKTYFRARHSFVIDALSGARLGVKSCAVPTLHLVRRDTDAIARAVSNSTLNSGASTPKSSQSFLRKPSFATGVDVSTENRQGWSMITAALERFEKAEPSCLPSAFLVLGSPGSGKSCLICRLIMDCLERHQNLVPMLLTVTDMVKRCDADAENAELDSAAVSAWFDKYLRITHGEDSARYKMLRQAIRMHRAVFLFEGLEDGGALTPIIEKLIRDIVMEGHLVVITSRPLIKGTSTLEGSGIMTMELENLTEAQQRSIAHARLGLQGLNSMMRFMANLRARQAVPGGEDESEQENVFSNPMMLSMLLCYLETKEREQRERGESAESTVTITDVYRVAVSVMLNRVQSKQQADRHNKDAQVDKCNIILEKMALKMQVQHTTLLDVASFEKDLQYNAAASDDLMDTWQSLKSAVVAGHAVFLRVSNDSEKMQMNFLVKGFQDFFAACAVARDDAAGDRLPPLVQLLTESSWSAMLEMLAEYRPARYANLIERSLDGYTADNQKSGTTFLHLAAEVGHKPVFEQFPLLSEPHRAMLQMTNQVEKQMPIHVAAGKGNIHLCGLMLQHKAQIDVEDAADRLPMHVALQNRQFHCAKFLLDRYMERKESGMGRTGGQRRSQSRDNPAERLAARILCTEEPLTDEKFRELVDESIPELRFFGKQEAVPSKQAIGALLSVFWICCNRYEQFVSEQKDDILSKGSWGTLRAWVQDTVKLLNNPSRVGAMLVFVAIAGLGKIKALREAMTPEITDPSEVLRSILHKTPVLIPSFSKLEPAMQNTILSCIQVDLNFGQFLQTEALPKNLVVVKDMIQKTGENEEAGNILGFFLFKIFSQMCGLFGMKSLNGSLFMTEKNYKNYQLGLDTVQLLMGDTPSSVYTHFLQARAQAQGLSFNMHDRQSRARVRFACLTRIMDEKGGQAISHSFDALDVSERELLTEYLCADGITEKAILPYGAPAFMENSMQNDKVGLTRAARMLLKVCQVALEEFKDSSSSVITIYFDSLAAHARDCKDSEIFEFTKFDIVRAGGHLNDCQGSIQLSPWQLVRDPSVFEKLQDEGGQLVTDTMAAILREQNFLKRLPQVFPELKYFVGDDPKVKVAYKQTLGTLLAAYWVASDHAEAFTRSQPNDRKLTPKSWRMVVDFEVEGREHQEFSQEEVLNCVFVAAAIQALGKIPKFREQLAPHSQTHQQALAHVMVHAEKVLPSFMRLKPACKDLVKQCVTQQFSFEQFMVGEAVPGSLLPIKRMLNTEGAKHQKQLYLHVFLRTAFSELSGSLGSESNEGSMYMTEDRFSKFRDGMEALQQLSESSGDAEKAAYDRLLRRRAENLHVPYDNADSDSRALVRLACLAEVVDFVDNTRVNVALKEFDADERATLFAFLNQDGLSQASPSYVLVGATAFLKNARANAKVNLAAGVRVLLKVYKAAAAEFEGCRRPIIYVHLDRLAAVTSDYRLAEPFQEIYFELHKIHETEAVIVPTYEVEELEEPLSPKSAPSPKQASPKQAEPKPSPDSPPGPPAALEKEAPAPVPETVGSNSPAAEVNEKLAKMMLEMEAMRKANAKLTEQNGSLMQANSTLRAENSVLVGKQKLALTEPPRLQDGYMTEVEAARLKQESQDLRDRLGKQASTQQLALSQAAAEVANAMAADAEQVHMRLRAECNELLERTGQLSSTEARYEAEAWKLRSELASAESGVNGLTMEIGELTMELAKLRAQASTDARLQRTSSEARIELLELRRQLLGRETMLGHEREIADKRLEAARRDATLLNERLDLATRERDWAMQELHGARSDERLANSRSRTLEDEGLGLRNRCDALEAQRRALQWEMEVMRSGGLTQSASAVQSPVAVSPIQISVVPPSPEMASPSSSSLNYSWSHPNGQIAGGATGSRPARNSGASRTGTTSPASPEAWVYSGVRRQVSGPLGYELTRQATSPLPFDQVPTPGIHGIAVQQHIPVQLASNVTPLSGARTPRNSSPTPVAQSLAGAFSPNQAILQVPDAARSFANSSIPVVRRMVTQPSAGIDTALTAASFVPPRRMDVSPRPSRSDGRWS